MNNCRKLKIIFNEILKLVKKICNSLITSISAISNAYLSYDTCLEQLSGKEAKLDFLEGLRACGSIAVVFNHINFSLF
jgi:hypothetical protein